VGNKQNNSSVAALEAKENGNSKEREKRNLGEGFHSGRDETARTAPGGDELNQNRTVRLQDRLFELALVNLRHAGSARHRQLRNRRGMIPESGSCSARPELLPRRDRP